MNNQQIAVQALTEELRVAISRIRSDDDYIAAAVSHGKMNPKLRAICISNTDIWEPLARAFPSLQDVVDDLASRIVDFVLPLPMELKTTAIVSLANARELQKSGMKIMVEVDVDDDAMPVNIYGVFEVRPDLKFAI